ncbi:MAG: hypothetical protein KatS3mg017_0561 [Fimbriimonadales bacterium]|nr:MAG: hypothetical protein KatS3mg017_0561 [Fimbriimonadales bacterium]
MLLCAMASRTLIEQAKQARDWAFFNRVLNSNQGVKGLLQALEQLGKLPRDFDPAPLINLAQHPHESVRCAAVKALSRLENPDLLTFFNRTFRTRNRHGCPSRTRLGYWQVKNPRGDSRLD